MALIGQTIEYKDGEKLLEGYYVYDDSRQGKLPAVLVSHTWAGRNAFVEEVARKIAGMGYVGFALDLYGKGVLGQSREECASLMQPFMMDRAVLQQRMNAALATAKQLPMVESGKVAAIGYCFGGLCVLDLARSGADIKGVVSFHGLLDAPGNTLKNEIKAKVLALHGRDDPMVSTETVLAFQQEMTDAGVDWQMVVYGHTQHAFTNPVANDPDFGTVYQAGADRRSWLAMQNFLAELFC